MPQIKTKLGDYNPDDRTTRLDNPNDWRLYSDGDRAFLRCDIDGRCIEISGFKFEQLVIRKDYEMAVPDFYPKVIKDETIPYEGNRYVRGTLLNFSVFAERTRLFRLNDRMVKAIKITRRILNSIEGIAKF